MSVPVDHGRVLNTATLIGKVVADALREHAPWAADVGETTKLALRDKWLEGLEGHATEVIAPLVDEVLASSSPASAVAGLLEHAARPTAQFGSTIQQFFVYGVMFSLASTALAPFTQQVANDLWAANPTRPVSPPDIAAGAVRGFTIGGTPSVTLPEGAVAEAAKSGISAVNMQYLADISGQAPALELLFEMARRGIISDQDATFTNLTQGIKEGDIKDQWIPFVTKLRYVTPSAADFVAAALRSIDPDNPAEPSAAGVGPGSAAYDNAKKWANQVGLEPAGWVNANPDWFDMMVSIAGRPPGIIELVEMVRRGFISATGVGTDVTSLEQAVSESDIKTKWFPVIEKFLDYYPPNGEITTLVKDGWITDEQATAMYTANGVDATLATAFLNEAHHQQIAQDKALAKGDIETLIQEQLIDSAQALNFLQRIGYTDDNANFIVSMANFRLELEVLRSGVRQVGELYVKRKINATEAKTGLEAFNLPAENVTSLLDTLTIERNSQLLIPTPAQVTGAAYYGVITDAEALTALENLGYRPYDAWLVLSDRLHEAAGPAPTGEGVTGLTGV